MNAFTSTLRPGIIALTETWLNDSINDAQIAVSSYSRPFRADRHDGRVGGGVCCFVRNDIYCQQLHNVLKPPSSIECLGMTFPTHHLLMILTYVPPNLSASVTQEVLNFFLKDIDTALEHMPDGRLIILGDFNQLPTTDIENVYSLNQIVNFNTRGDAKLDKIFIDDSLQKIKMKDPVPFPAFGRSDHLSVYVPAFKERNTVTAVCKVHDFRKSNMNEFLRKLEKAPWKEWYRSNEDIDKKSEMFYEFIHDSMSELPCAHVEMKNTDKQWMTPTLKHIINCKHEAFRSKNFPLYDHYRLKVQTEIKKAKLRYLNRLKSDRKGIWKLTKSVSTRETSSIQPLLTSFPSPTVAVDAINESLCQCFSPAPDWLKIMDQIPKTTGIPTWQPHITAEGTHHALSKLKENKSAGSDGLHPRILRASADIIAKPIAHLFCLSTMSGKLPNCWKIANVTPIPKSKDITLNNLRPISLLPVISKILEDIVLTSIKDELISLYGDEQYGFRPHSSTLIAHLALHEFITSSLDDDPKCTMFILSFDMSRAFDRLEHSHLMDTLLHAKLPAEFLRWCANFLRGRSQRVKVLNFVSSLRQVSSGVPQGSKLAPILFACHMGSLKPYYPNSRVFKYADDVIIAKAIRDCDDINEHLNYEMENMSKWCENNGLVLNSNKTKVLVFNRRNKRPIAFCNFSPVSEIKLLGVIFQQNLSWDKHIDNICKNASRRIYLLKQLKKIESVTHQDLITVYNAFVRSILEFNCPLVVGMNKKNKRKLNLVQKRCHRIICGNDCRCEAFTNLDNRREALAMKIFLKMMNPNNLLNNIAPQFLPSSRRLRIPTCVTNRRLASFVPFCTLMYNKLFS